MALKYPDRLESNNPLAYGVVIANLISGHRTVQNLTELTLIADPILSSSGNNLNNDAIGLKWYVVSELVCYVLNNWKLRRQISGWKKDTNIELETIVLNHISDSTNPHNVTKEQVGLNNVTNDALVKRSEMGVASGVATLDDSGKIIASQLPSFVDDVIEASSKSSFPNQGESGKIYVALDTNLSYRWGGTSYIEIANSIALGETSSTAYAGDKGKQTTDNLNKHLSDHNNPHLVNKTLIGLSNVDNTSDLDKPLSTATKAELNKKLDEENAQEYNVSKRHPNLGIGNSNKYTLQLAIQLIPQNLRYPSIKCTFITPENEVETWTWEGNEFTNIESWHLKEGGALKVEGETLITGGKFISGVDIASETERKLAEIKREELETSRNLEFLNIQNKTLEIINSTKEIAVKAEEITNNLTHYIPEYNVSLIHPNEGINKTNIYTLKEAINKVPLLYRNIGLKITFFSDNYVSKTYIWNGGDYNDINTWNNYTPLNILDIFNIPVTNFYSYNGAVKIKYSKKLDLLLNISDWFAIVYYETKDWAGRFNITYSNPKGLYLTIKHGGTNFTINYNGGSMKFLNYSSNSYQLHIVNININSGKLEHYIDGKLILLGTMENSNFNIDDIKLNYKFEDIIFGKDIPPGFIFLGITNYYIDINRALRMYNDGLCIKNICLLSEYAKSFIWDNTEYINKDTYHSNLSGESAKLINNNTFKVTHINTDNNLYICSRVNKIPANSNEFIYMNIKVISGKIKLVGLCINGQCTAEIYNTSNNSKIEDNILGSGDYYIKNISTNTYSDSLYLVNYNVLEPAIIEFSNLRTRKNGYVMAINSNHIFNNLVKFNQEITTPFLGITNDDLVVKDTIINSDTNINATFIGQKLRVYADMYIATKGGEKSWVKINN